MGGYTQGINPNELLLNLKVLPKPGIWPQHVTAFHVRYDSVPYTARYTGVTVQLPNKGSVHFQVEGNT